jgi:hypothetical protein
MMKVIVKASCISNHPARDLTVPSDNFTSSPHMCSVKLAMASYHSITVSHTHRICWRKKCASEGCASDRAVQAQGSQGLHEDAVLACIGLEYRIQAGLRGELCHGTCR